MKRAITTLSVILILGLLLLPNANFAIASQTTDTDVKIAYKKAEAQIALMSDLTHPHWKGAVAVNPEPYCDLAGQVICYVFSIEKNSKEVGYIIIGSQLYLYSFFEASDGLPPKTLTEDEVQSILDKQIPTNSEFEYSAKLLFNFYSGGFKEFYAVYDVSGKIIAINLYSHNVFSCDDLTFGLLPSEKYRKLKEQSISIRSFGYKNLSIGLYDSFNDCTNPSTGCGPGVSNLLREFRIW